MGFRHAWRQDKIQFAPKHVQATLQGGGGSVTIWECVSYARKYAQNRQKYI